MPSCHTAIRTLCREHRRFPLRFPAPRRLPQWLPDSSHRYRFNHSTSVSHSRQDASFSQPDRKRVTADAETACQDSLTRSGKGTSLADTHKNAHRQHDTRPRETGNDAGDALDGGRQQHVQAEIPRNAKARQLMGHLLTAFRYSRPDSNHMTPSPSKEAVSRATPRSLSASINKNLADPQRWLHDVQTLVNYFRFQGRRRDEDRRGTEKDWERPIVPVMIPSTIGMVERVYAALDEGVNLRKFLLLRTTALSVTLWFLHYDPSTALDVVMAANGKGLRRRQMELALHCLAAQYSLRRDEANMKRLVEALPTFSLAYPPLLRPLTRFHESFYNITVTHMTEEAISGLYEDLKTHERTRIGASTWLNFARAFLNHHMADEALDALVRAKRAGGDVDSVPFLKLCSRLLRTANSTPGSLRTCLRIVDTLVGMGVPLNNNLTNIIMLNAVEAGDLKTAMGIYHSRRDHGLRPDVYTFAIFLKACKSSIDDAKLLKDTIRAAIDEIDVLKAPVVATEILHCLALHHTKHHPENAFETVADAYAQLFSLAAPRLVGLVPSKLSHVQNQNGLHRPQPRPQDIYILLATFLEQSFTKTSLVDQAYQVWLRFKHAIEAGQEPFASMAETDYVFNAFLCTFIKTKRGLLHAAEVIKYMQIPDEAGAEYIRVRPTVLTWSIFVHGFTRHGKMYLAEQVLTYMRGKGIQPNIVTWNTLLGGYAKDQDLEGVMDTIRRLETDGYQWDRWTAGNLRRYRDSAAIEAELRQSEVSKGVLKGDLETRIQDFGSGVDMQVNDEGEQERIERAYFADDVSESVEYNPF